LGPGREKAENARSRSLMVREEGEKGQICGSVFLDYRHTFCFLFAIKSIN
jgi:hypothetical protein